MAQNNVCRKLVFSPLPPNESVKPNISTAIRKRQQALGALITKFKEGNDVGKWFHEFMDRAGQGFLNNNQGCIINVLMASVPVGTEFGDHLREGIKSEWERARAKSNLSIDITENDTATDLLEHIVEHVQLTFPRDLQDTPESWVKKCHHFKMLKNESIQGYYNRCNEIVRKLSQHGQGLSPLQKDNMYKEGLHIRLQGPVKQKNVQGLANLHSATMSYVRDFNLEQEFPLSGDVKASSEEINLLSDEATNSKGPSVAAISATDSSKESVPRSWFEKPCQSCSKSDDEKKKKNSKYHSYGMCWDNPDAVVKKGQKRSSSEKKDSSHITCYI